MEWNSTDFISVAHDVVVGEIMRIDDTLVCLDCESYNGKQVIFLAVEVEKEILDEIAPSLRVLIPIRLVLGNTPIGVLGKFLYSVEVFHTQQDHIVLHNLNFVV